MWAAAVSNLALRSTLHCTLFKIAAGLAELMSTSDGGAIARQADSRASNGPICCTAQLVIAGWITFTIWDLCYMLNANMSTVKVLIAIAEIGHSRLILFWWLIGRSVLSVLPHIRTIELY